MSGKTKTFDLEAQTKICALCPNMCRFLCPVAASEKIETITPRGKATLALAVERGEVEFDETTAEVFYHCAACKICREWCPSNVDLPEATSRLRERAAREGSAPEAARNLKERLVAGGSLYRPAAEVAEGRWRYVEMLTRGAKVLYFAGCATAALQPDVIAATLRLFEASGVKVDMLEGEECCGLPLETLGYAGEAAGFAGRAASAIAAGGYDTVVSGCPMCTYVFKESYPAWGAGLGAKVQHVSEFFFDLAEEGALVKHGRSYDGAVTYHDPCFLGRYQGVYDAPRRLLADVAGLKLVEMERSRELASCCGGTPALDFVDPRTATGIGGRRVDEARRTGAATLVTACPHCLEMLGSAAEDQVEVRDICEVLAERFGVWPRSHAALSGAEK